jgi:hypothetical protein
MPEPFISRRCQNCGASIRKSGSFCPQCGTSAVGSGLPGAQERSKSAGPERKSNITKKLTEPSPGKNDPDARLGAKSGQSVQHSSRPGNVPFGGVLGSRVDRIKDRSQAMIDEAAVDPSFRFILVTAVLFVLFLLLLFSSHVLR